jgi:hypothetical protein
MLSKPPALLIFSLDNSIEPQRSPLVSGKIGVGEQCSRIIYPYTFRTVNKLSNVISMDDHVIKGQSIKAAVRDRRYAIRFPFAADVDILDMESGTRAAGVTSDISLGGCFVCTSKPFAVGTRVRITMSRRMQTVEALAVVRILKPRIGMGIEFIDVEGPYNEILRRWMEQVRQTR